MKERSRALEARPRSEPGSVPHNPGMVTPIELAKMRIN